MPAPVASSLCARYTHRAVVIIGGLLAFSGMTLRSFGFNTVWMYTTTGFLQGVTKTNPTKCPKEIAKQMVSSAEESNILILQQKSKYKTKPMTASKLVERITFEFRSGTL
ncbi:hypothetical protein KIL84_013611 [Mauremys mutica]|uniref:Uncharacterized protein n=1 Tax=Mauremys mutica TaxID=74926 RepID=A0A9D4AUG4_9SAUR|nr:hypothetical protein KIL84_013611 [Mauremys mutica]